MEASNGSEVHNLSECEESHIKMTKMFDVDSVFVKVTIKALVLKQGCGISVGLLSKVAIYVRTSKLGLCATLFHCNNKYK